MDESQSQLLTAEQVANFLQLKPSTIYEAASKGRIPCVRLWQGRRRTLLRFRREDLEAFVRARMETVTAADK